MIYLELCKDFVKELGIAGGQGPASVEGQTGELQNVVRWIRDAALWIDNMWRDWRYLWREYDVNTSSHLVPMPALPANFPVRDWNRDSVYLNHGTAAAQKMTYMPWQDWRHQLAGGYGSGRPSEFTERPDRQIILNRIPTAATPFHAEYWKRPTRLAGNNAVPDLPDEYHRLIVCRAAVFYGNKEAAPEVISGMEAEYTDLLEKVQSAELETFRNDFMAGQDVDLAVAPPFRGG